MPTSKPARKKARAKRAAAPPAAWERYLRDLHACRDCPTVHSHAVVGAVAGAQIYLLGQAPGPKEPGLGRPFAWTAGRTLFRWFASLGVDEATFRARAHMAAVISCFPGKLAGKQGDRKPAREEIANCRRHREREFALLRPQLVIPVGRMAIEQCMPCPSLEQVVGRCYRLELHGVACDVIPLPHPSGLSRWIQTLAGKAAIARALKLLGEHPAWRSTFGAGTFGAH